MSCTEVYYNVSFCYSTHIIVSCTFESTMVWEQICLYSVMYYLKVHCISYRMSTLKSSSLCWRSMVETPKSLMCCAHCVLVMVSQLEVHRTIFVISCCLARICCCKHSWWTMLQGKYQNFFIWISFLRIFLLFYA